MQPTDSLVRSSRDRVSPEARARAIAQLNAAHERNKDRALELEPYILSYWSEIGAEVGSGKTLSMCSVAARYYAYGVKVYHNGPLRFGEQWDLGRLMALDYENCCICIDEIAETFHRYRVQSTVQLNLVGALVMLRKAGVQILTTGQSEDEISSSLLRRSRYAIYCRTFDGGRSVMQRVVYRPKTEEEQMSGIRKKWMNRFWGLYDSWQRFRPGEYRLTTGQLKARRERELYEAVTSLIAGAYERGDRELSALIVARWVYEAKRVEASVASIGRLLGDIGLQRVQRSTGNVWLIPDELFAPAPDDFDEHPETAGNGRAP